MTGRMMGRPIPVGTISLRVVVAGMAVSKATASSPIIYIYCVCEGLKLIEYNTHIYIYYISDK